MTGKGRELADMMERRTVDILCVQETKWKGSKARIIGAGFKLFYYGVDSKRNGVGVVLKEEFVRNVLEVKRVSDRVMSLKFEIEGVMLNVVSGYAPQVGCELEEKERFWSELDEVIENIPMGERVVIGADFNGHVGEGNTGDEEVMGKFGVKERNLEGQMVVDFAKRMDMALVNTYFQKREEHRVTYKSGGKGRELADMMERRKVDILCVQETRWKGSKARSIGAGFKLFYYGVDSKRNGVGVVLKEEFVRNVLEVKRVSDRVMSLKLEIEGVMLNVVSGYAPQVRCELEEKERFWSELDEVIESIPTGERVVIGADFNGHVGEGNTGDEVMSKFGVKERNLEGQMVVDFAKRMDMAVVNTYFQKREEHRLTYKSGGKGRELADMMERRKVDILCVQETRWKGSKARSIGAGFKLLYYGVDSKRNGVGVVLKEEFGRNVLEVKKVSDRVMSLKLETEGVMLDVVSGYAPQVGCELEEKERFWSELDEVIESIPTGERVVIGADFNGHVGEGNTGDEEVMGKFGVKERNLEGQMVVDFAKRLDMAVINTYFQKREEHRVTYKSGDCSVLVV
ncbi:hypothetical protein PDJAM_G00176620 [Pangasius djambal]|uniref:Uncharacterized protein n=1 Tax=Pangasius djambal TaxID=1691987 RepID=A0ACC5ZQ97_9TELE|nr:hypothetical protein [Pangasius djambal]